MDSRIFANSALWQLWTYCLMKANHRKQWVPMITGRGETEIEIQAGQFIFGRHTWAKKLKIKPSTLWNMMLKLKRLQYLDMQSNNICTIVTIRNWKVYQQRENIVGQLNGQRVESDMKTNGQRTDTNKNDKNDKNDKNKHIEFVFLTEKEHEKLIGKFGNSITNEKIEKLNNYIGSTGKKYKSHYHTILNWASKEPPTPKPTKPTYSTPEERKKADDDLRTGKTLSFQEVGRRLMADIKKRKGGKK